MKGPCSVHRDAFIGQQRRVVDRTNLVPSSFVRFPNLNRYNFFDIKVVRVIPSISTNRWESLSFSSSISSNLSNCTDDVYRTTSVVSNDFLNVFDSRYPPHRFTDTKPFVPLENCSDTGRSFPTQCTHLGWQFEHPAGNVFDFATRRPRTMTTETDIKRNRLTLGSVRK